MAKNLGPRTLAYALESSVARADRSSGALSRAFRNRALANVLPIENRTGACQRTFPAALLGLA
jgi:hypothetical protein